MSEFNVKYKYHKSGSSGGATSSFRVKADSDTVALDIARGIAQSKHPNYEVVITEVKKVR